uniref:Transcription factor IIIA n=1 Tax=Sus scrofa TaxID=9823 RepID=A0A287AAC5_PIG
RKCRGLARAAFPGSCRHRFAARGSARGWVPGSGRPGAAGFRRRGGVVLDHRRRVYRGRREPHPAACRSPSEVHLLLPRLQCQLQQGVETRRAPVQAHGGGKEAAGRPFVCDHEGCGKAFVRDYHLSRHALTHTGEKPFVCAASGCDQKFNTKSNLKKHFERKHENQQKQYVCSFEGCKKTFKKHQQLKTHQCQHTNEPLFKLYLSKRMFFCGKNMDRASETRERNS